MDWSPFYCLPRAQLTPSGLIQLDTNDQEVLLLRRPGIELRHEGPTPMAPRPRGLGPSVQWKQSSGEESVLVITTHRCVLQKSNETNGQEHPEARFLHLSNIRTCEASGGPSLMSPNSSYKIRMNTKTFETLILVFPAKFGTSTARSDRDSSLQELTRALERKRWEVATRLELKQLKADSRFNSMGSANHKVGLDRILAKNKARHEENAKLATEALSGDSEQLLTQAAELLKVIQKYTVMIKKSEGSNENDETTAKLKGLLSDMGMTSALSQSNVLSGGSRVKSPMKDFHELTARQVADFLVPRLRHSKTGMMSLTDVYCLFNRARGTNLISPEDMRDSCALLENLNVGIRQRTFPSGIVVLQLEKLVLNSTNYEARRKFLDLCEEGATALEASHVLQLSPLLANEQLEEAERLGWLCRDVTLSTTRFYPNRFITAF